MSRELIDKLIELRKEHPDYSEELTLTINRLCPKKSGKYLTDIVNSYIDIICKEKGVSRNYFLSKRKREVSYPRMSLMAYLKFNSTLTLVEIGKIFGNKHYSTVIHAVGNINDAIQLNSYNQELSDVFHKIKNALD